jgi:hypothetical protein
MSAPIFKFTQLELWKMYYLAKKNQGMVDKNGWKLMLILVWQPMKIEHTHENKLNSFSFSVFSL